MDSGFDHATTAMNVIKGIELKGQTIVMTGGHSGIGLEVTQAFTSAGAKVETLSKNLEMSCQLHV